MNIIFAIAAGGALGSVLRHCAVIALNAAFPYGTLLVNVFGSFLIGLLVEWLALRGDLPQEVRAFIVTGFLGGFTTFSAFSFDALKLMETGQGTMTALYILLSVALSLAAVFFGVYLVRHGG